MKKNRYGKPSLSSNSSTKKLSMTLSTAAKTGLRNTAKRDVNQSKKGAQTRQGQTTTLGPDNTLLANGDNSSINLSLRPSAFKQHLPSLASSSLQLSSAIQRLISNKFGISLGGQSGANADSNHQQLTNNPHYGFNNQTSIAFRHNKKKPGQEGGSVLLIDKQHHKQHNHQSDGDFGSTSASDHSHSLLSSMPPPEMHRGPHLDSAPPGHLEHYMSNQFVGNTEHQFDLAAAAENHESEGGEPPNRHRLNELISQWQGSGEESDGDNGEGSHGAASVISQIDDQSGPTTSLLNLQAAQQHLHQTRLFGPNSAASTLINGGQRSASTNPGKQLIPIEIIGLDPGVTNQILYGSKQHLTAANPNSLQQAQRQGHRLFASINGVDPQSAPINNGDGSGGSGGGSSQVGSASELDIQENPMISSSADEYERPGAGPASGAMHQHRHLQHYQQRQVPSVQQQQEQEQSGGDQENNQKTTPSSIVHIHHFHHTSELDGQQQQQQQQQQHQHQQQQEIGEQEATTQASLSPGQTVVDGSDGQQAVGEVVVTTEQPEGTTKADSQGAPSSQVEKSEEGSERESPQADVSGVEAATSPNEQLQVDPDAKSPGGAKKIRFVTRNSFRDKQNNNDLSAQNNTQFGLKLTPSTTAPTSMGNSEFYLQQVLEKGTQSLIRQRDHLRPIRANQTLPRHQQQQQQQQQQHSNRGQMTRFVPTSEQLASGFGEQTSDGHTDFHDHTETEANSSNNNNNLLMVSYKPTQTVVSPSAPSGQRDLEISNVVEPQNQLIQQDPHSIATYWPSTRSNITNSTRLKFHGGPKSNFIDLPTHLRNGANIFNQQIATNQNNFPRHLLPYNEGSESNPLLISTLNHQHQQHLQNLVNNSSRTFHLPSPTNLIGSFLKQQNPKLNAASLLKQIQEKLSPISLSQPPLPPPPQPSLPNYVNTQIGGSNGIGKFSQLIEPTWMRDDEKLISQFNLINQHQLHHHHNVVGPSSNHNMQPLTNNTRFSLPDLHFKSNNSLTLRNNGLNPFDAQYQNFVDNLSLLHQLKQTQQKALQDDIGGSKGTLMINNKSASNRLNSQLAPANQMDSSNQNLTARLTSNELALVMQEQLNKMNKTLSNSVVEQFPNNHQMSPQTIEASPTNSNNGGGGSRYELTSASDRLVAPAKSLKTQQLQSNVTRNKLALPSATNSNQLFTANDNFHVPNISNKLPVNHGRHSQAHNSELQIKLKSSLPSLSVQGVGGNSNVSRNKHGSGTSEPDHQSPQTATNLTSDNLMDSPSGLSNLAFAFIFFVSLLTFVLIAASLMYRRRRTFGGGASSTNSTNSISDLPSESGNTTGKRRRFNFTQRTKHLVRSNFSGCRQQLTSRKNNLNQSSLKSLKRLSSPIVSPTGNSGSGSGENGGIASASSGNNNNKCTTNVAIKSAWRHQMRPTLEPLEADISNIRCQSAAQMAAAMANATHQGCISTDNNYINKYVCANGSNLGVNAVNKLALASGSHHPHQATVPSSRPNVAKYQSTSCDTLGSNPDSDIKTLNTRVQKAACILNRIKI